MTISEWADRLGTDPRDRRNRLPDEIWAICPCHSDEKPSLHVYVGERTGEIVMKCHVCGATGKDVCKALGLPLSEVMCDARTGEKQQRGSAAPRAREAKAPKISYPFAQGKTWKDGYTVTAIYEYQTPDGAVVLRKARREKRDEHGERKKTFNVQSLGTDGKWYATDGIYGSLIYHLPEVVSAIERGERILIAEGEKDVDNLRKLGYVATCGLYGAGTGALEGKWSEDHSKRFDGAAEVVVIPDNDGPGETLAQWILKRLRGRVGKLRILRIAESCPDLPTHGDFTDWVELQKAAGIGTKSALLAKFDALLDGAREWEPGNILRFDREPQEEPDKSQADPPAKRGDASGGGGENDYPSYYGSPAYCIKGGRLAHRVKDGAQVLCDFLPVPRETITRDDGSSLRTEYVIGGTRPDGAPLEDAHVEGEAELAAMRWAMRAWLHWGNIKPVRNAAQMILDAINIAGQQQSRHRSIYEHTGMRRIGGRMAYLYNGGAIGAEDVSVELAGDLKHYDLRKRDKVSREEAAIAEAMLLRGFPARIIYPQLAQAYLAPLYSVMERLQRPPSYVVFVVGAPTAGKSTVAGYVQAHFGNFYNRRFPARFTDTVNAARDKLFWAKDALLVVDDYQREESSGRMRSAQDMVANGVISAVADLSDRSRLDADKRQSDSRPPRCTCIMTGEDIPRISQSRLLRIYRIDVALGDIYKTSATELEPYRLMARDGIYAQCMRAYIEDLLSRWDGIEDELEERIDRMSRRMEPMIKRREGRLIECATHLMVGVDLMLEHLERYNAIDRDERIEMTDEAERAITATIEEQGAVVDESRPEAIWLQTLRSLIVTRAATLRSTNEIGDGFVAGMIGFYDEQFYYLDPSATDEYIGERLRKGGQTLSASRQAILRELARQGLIACKYKEDGSIKETTYPMRIGHGQQRMIRLYKYAITGDPPPGTKAEVSEPVPEDEQTKLPF